MINGLLMNLYLLIFNFGLNLFTQMWGERISCLHNTAPHVKQSWLCFTFYIHLFVLFCFVFFLFCLVWVSSLGSEKFFREKCASDKEMTRKVKISHGDLLVFSVILMKSLNRNESQSVSLWVRVIWRVSWTIIYHASSARSAREKVIFFTYLSQ